MNPWQKQVRAFHRKLGYPAPSDLTFLGDIARRHRQALITEESIEASNSLDGGGPHKVAGELADLIYVALGTAVSMGLDLDPHFRAVHRANMQKENPSGGLYTKATKPQGWKRPDHWHLILNVLNRPPMWRRALWAAGWVAVVAAATYVGLNAVRFP